MLTRLGAYFGARAILKCAVLAAFASAGMLWLYRDEEFVSQSGTVGAVGLVIFNASTMVGAMFVFLILGFPIARIILRDTAKKPRALVPSIVFWMLAAVGGGLSVIPWAIIVGGPVFMAIESTRLTYSHAILAGSIATAYMSAVTTLVIGQSSRQDSIDATVPRATSKRMPAFRVPRMDGWLRLSLVIAGLVWPALIAAFFLYSIEVPRAPRWVEYTTDAELRQMSCGEQIVWGDNFWEGATITDGHPCTREEVDRVRYYAREEFLIYWASACSIAIAVLGFPFALSYGVRFAAASARWVRRGFSSDEA